MGRRVWLWSNAPSSKFSDLREIRTRLLEGSDFHSNEVVLTIDLPEDRMDNLSCWCLAGSEKRREESEVATERAHDAQSGPQVHFKRPWFHFFFSFLSFFFRATPSAYGGSQARGQNSCTHWPTPQPQQHQIQATSATYTTTHSNIGSLTHWVRPGIQPVSSDSFLLSHDGNSLIPLPLGPGLGVGTAA